MGSLNQSTRFAPPATEQGGLLTNRSYVKIARVETNFVKLHRPWWHTGLLCLVQLQKPGRHVATCSQRTCYVGHESQ